MVQQLWDVIRLRLRSFMRRKDVEDDLDEELTGHIERTIAQHVQAGVPEAEARRLALSALGGFEARKHELRDLRGFLWLREAIRDARQAGRIFRRRPGFAVLVGAVLALSIGATATMFSIVYGSLWRPLPFPEPNRLFVLSAAPSISLFGNRVLGLTEQHYNEVHAHSRLFESTAAMTWNGATATLAGPGGPLRVYVTDATGDFFNVLHARPALGRVFSADDELPGTKRIVVSDRLWRRAFAARTNVVTSTATLDGVPYEIIGVMPASFGFPADTDIWRVSRVTVDAHNATLRPVIGRLKPDATAAQAAAELGSLVDVTQPPFSGSDDPWIVQVLPLPELLIGEARRSLVLFACAIGFVLLVACANVAGLFLVRTAERDRELTLRGALGAGRARLVRQLAVESCLISVIGGGAGVALAYAALPALLRLVPAGSIPRLEAVHVDALAVTVAFAIAVSIGVVAGVLPALGALRRASRPTARDRSSTDQQERLRGALVIVEVVLSLVLLAGAGLMVKSLTRLEAVSPGFEPRHLTTATIDLPDRFGTGEAIRDYRTAVLTQLSRLPDVVAASSVNWMPFGGNVLSGDFTLEGGRALPPDYMADKPVVTPHYFATMGLRLRGRDFSEGDRAGAPGVVIISESVARDLWPGADAIGRRISMNDHPGPDDWLTIVGVAADVRQMTLTQEMRRTIYLPAAQTDRVGWLHRISFIARTGGDSPALAAALRGVFREVDPLSPPPDIVSMRDRIDETTATPRFQSWLLASFATMALGLTLVGVYALLAYAVSRRTREFGVRMALGADTPRIVWLVAGRMLRLLIIGIVLGTAGGLATTRVLQAFLFDVTPTDPLTFASVAALLGIAGLAAAAVPAWRAAHVDPTRALRAD